MVLESFNKKYIKRKCHSYTQRFRMYEELLREARQLKKIPLQNPLEGIEACILVASTLNSLK